MSTEKSSTPFSITELPVKRAELGLPKLRYSSPSPVEGLTAVSFPRFPTVAELAEIAAASPAPQRRDLGLFEVYLHKRPELLLHAAQENPERFSDEVNALLSELYAGDKDFEDLLPEEQTAINLATAEFFSAPRIAKETPKPPATKKVPAERLTLEPLIEHPVVGPDLDPFWWT